MNATKDLLKINRFALRVLHDYLQYDFQRPHAVIRYGGRFTPKAVQKEAEKAGFSIFSKIAVLTMDSDPRAICGRELRVATIAPSGLVSVDIEIPYWYERLNVNISKYYTKRAFDDMRKRDTAVSFFIVQSPEDAAPARDKKRDLSSRFRYVPQPSELCGDGKGTLWYRSILLQETEGSGERFRFEPLSASCYTGIPHTDNIRDIIDKSGYLLEERRYNLKHMAAQLRAKRAAERFAQENTAPDVEKLGKLVQAEKSSIISALQSAKTADDFSKLSYLLYRDFSPVLRRFAEHKDKAERKEYPSVYVYSAAAEGIKKSLSDLHGKLQKEAGEND